MNRCTTSTFSRNAVYSRSPAAFEGLVIVVVLTDANDHPVADREQLVVGRVNLGTAGCAAPDLARLHQCLIVPAVDDPMDLVSAIVEAIEPLLQPLPDALATAYVVPSSGALHSISGWQNAIVLGIAANKSALLVATSYHRRAISTFSRGIAESVDPTLSGNRMTVQRTGLEGSIPSAPRGAGTRSQGPYAGIS